MGRFGVKIDGEDDAGNGDVIDEQWDPTKQTWQDRVRAVVHQRRTIGQMVSAIVPYRGGSDGYSPDHSEVQYLGSRKEIYDDGSDSDATQDLTGGATQDLTGFFDSGDANEQHETHEDAPARRRKTSRRWYWYAVAVVLVAYFCAPPPPPSPDDAVVHESWGHYRLEKGQLLISAFKSASKDTLYTTRGLASNVYNNAADLCKTLSDLSKTLPDLINNLPWPQKDAPCSLLVPSNDPSEELSTEELLLEGIVGQDRAMKTIARALDAWEVPQPNEKSVGTPLVLYLTGPVGSGKTETARLISRIVFSHCQSEIKKEGTQSVPGNEVLRLNGNDFSNATALAEEEDTLNQDSDEPTDSASPDSDVRQLRVARRFREVITDHVRSRRGAGAVFVIHKLQFLTPPAVGELLRLVEKPDASMPHEASNGIRWDNVLFILTSDIGAMKGHDLIHAYKDRDSVNQKHLEQEVRDELDIYFHDSWIGNVVHAVAPLLPLGLEEVEEIMRRKIRYLSDQHAGQLWLRLDVTDAALKYFVGCEQLECRGIKSTGSTGTKSIFTYSERGFHTLANGILMQTLKAAIRGQGAAKLDHRPDRVAVFDFVPHLDEAKIVWCPDRDAKDKYTSLDGEDCEQAWYRNDLLY